MTGERQREKREGWKKITSRIETKGIAWRSEKEEKKTFFPRAPALSSSLVPSVQGKHTAGIRTITPAFPPSPFVSCLLVPDQSTGAMPSGNGKQLTDEEGEGERERDERQEVWGSAVSSVRTQRDGRS